MLCPCRNVPGNRPRLACTCLRPAAVEQSDGAGHVDVIKCTVALLPELSATKCQNQPSGEEYQRVARTTLDALNHMPGNKLILLWLRQETQLPVIDTPPRALIPLPVPNPIVDRHLALTHPALTMNI
jgi:hypothetical protein